MVTPVEKRSSNKFCEFHNDKGHITDECVQLRKQIEELVRAGKLSHFIKEIRQDRDQQKTGKKDALVKDKVAAIYMIQPWQRMTRQKVIQSFARVKEITFPPLTANKGTEGPLVIEAEIGRHAVHRMETLDIFDVSRRHERSPRSIIRDIRTQYREKGYPLSTEKGPGPGARQGNPSKGTKTSRGRNSVGSLVPRLVIQFGHGEEA
ncbi:hypothetical protein Tco_0363748 [Tanacetum coccineum]